jgi:hypothetical protein
MTNTVNIAEQDIINYKLPKLIVKDIENNILFYDKINLQCNLKENENLNCINDLPIEQDDLKD